MGGTNLNQTKGRGERRPDARQTALPRPTAPQTPSHEGCPLPLNQRASPGITGWPKFDGLCAEMTCPGTLAPLQRRHYDYVAARPSRSTSVRSGSPKWPMAFFPLASPAKFHRAAPKSGNAVNRHRNVDAEPPAGRLIHVSISGKLVTRRTADAMKLAAGVGNSTIDDGYEAGLQAASEAKTQLG